MIINHEDILGFETRYRSNFINSLGGFKSLVLVGTKSNQGNENLAVFSSLFHLGANPALCGIIIRPNEELQNTLGNILHTKIYTLNHVTPEIFKMAHQTSAKYKEGESEFKHVGLAPHYIDGLNAPFVVESKVKFACEFVQKNDIELNGTYLIIGKIIKVILPDEIVCPDGFLELELAQSITVSGLDSYHTTQKIDRLTYAKVGQSPNSVLP